MFRTIKIIWALWPEFWSLYKHVRQAFVKDEHIPAVKHSLSVAKATLTHISRRHATVQERMDNDVFAWEMEE